MRDFIFKHVSKLTNKKGFVAMTGTLAIRYCLTGFLIAGILTTIACTIGLIMRNFVDIKQEWLSNLHNSCGKKYKIDENGNWIYDTDKLFSKAMANQLSLISIPLGLYLGQVWFRFSGSGRLTQDSYAKPIWLQLVFSAIGACLVILPWRINETFDSDPIGFWCEKIYILAIP